MLLRLYLNIELYDPSRGTFEQWMCTVTRNVLRNIHRWRTYLMPANVVGLEEAGEVADDGDAARDPSSAALSSAALSSAALPSAALSSEALSSAALSSAAFSSEALSSAALSSADLSSEALSSEALSSEALSSEAFSSADLSSEALPSEALSSEAFSSEPSSGGPLQGAPLTPLAEDYPHTYAALMELTALQRHILLLTAEGWAVRDIARRLHLDAASVSATLYRARQAMAQRLRPARATPAARAAR